MTFLYDPCPGGVRLLRVYGDTPCPRLPERVAGLPVTELGAYCFAAREPRGGTIWTEPSPQPASQAPAIGGDFLEAVTLPDTLRVLHSAAFYNCRRLRRVEFGPRLNSLGSDLFTNCRALCTLAVRAAPDAPTGLKKLLSAISADIEVEFRDGTTLFYPEYFELLDENAPAHLFNRTIEGEGYRLRQCFTAAGAVDFAAYDAAFAQLTVSEEPPKACRAAIDRLLSPAALRQAARDDYIFYLNAHPAPAFALAVAGRDAAALRMLAGLGLPVREAAGQCAAAGWSEGAALLLGRPHKAAKQYEF